MSKIRHWIVEDGRVRGATLGEWAAFVECADGHVAETWLGKYRVSTVFMGLNLGWIFDDEERPILFETMVFSKHKRPDGKWQCKRRQYRSMTAALSGHAEMVLELMNEHPRLEPRHEQHKCGRVPEERKARFAEIVANITARQNDLPDFLK